MTKRSSPCRCYLGRNRSQNRSSALSSSEIARPIFHSAAGSRWISGVAAGALTGRLPYGEIEPYQSARYRRDPAALSRIRPDVPIWLDHLVRKAIARDPRARFETAEELLLALERGASRPVSAPAATPLIHRDPAALWKLGLAISLLLNALLLFWLLFLPR